MRKFWPKKSKKEKAVLAPGEKRKINSRAKGSRGELEIAHWLKENGIHGRRGQQFAGGTDSPDVIHDIPGVHLEVKRTETLSLYVALEQAKRDAPNGHTPVVLHRRTNMQWVAILSADAWLELVKEKHAKLLAEVLG